MLVLNIFLALAWVAFTGELTSGNFFAGFLVGYGAMWVAQDVLGCRRYVKLVPRALGFFLCFMGEVVKSSARVALEVVTPQDTMHPAIIAVPLDASTDFEIILLSSCITLTPGSLTLDLSADRKTLYVHEMYVRSPEEARRSIKEGIERRLLEVTR